MIRLELAGYAPQYHGLLCTELIRLEFAFSPRLSSVRSRVLSLLQSFLYPLCGACTRVNISSNAWLNIRLYNWFVNRWLCVKWLNMYKQILEYVHHEDTIQYSNLHFKTYCFNSLRIIFYVFFFFGGERVGGTSSVTASVLDKQVVVSMIPLLVSSFRFLSVRLLFVV